MHLRSLPVGADLLFFALFPVVPYIVCEQRRLWRDRRYIFMHPSMSTLAFYLILMTTHESFESATVFIFGPQRDKTNKMTCAPSEDSSA